VEDAKAVKRIRIDDCFEPLFTLNESLARMVAEDGMSFRQVSNSRVLAQFYGIANYLNSPKNHTVARNKVMEFKQHVQNKMISEIAEAKKVGKFSIAIDEWTSIAHRKYLSVILISNTSMWNLGLERVIGSATSFNLKGLIEKKLNEFKVELQDVIALSDGASVMTCLGSMLQPIQQQLCLAHAIQLAVLKVLYKKSDCSNQSNLEYVSDELDEDGSDDSIDINDDFEMAISEWESNFGVETEPLESSAPVLESSYLRIIEKCRSIIKVFRKSTNKNDVLQNYIVQAQGHEKQLVLDVPTRWNSLSDMLERFVEVALCVQKACIDVKIVFDLNETDLQLLEELVATLKPVKSTVQALCRQNSNLMIADALLSKLITFLNNQNTNIADKMAVSLQIEITKRRTILSDVLKYLHLTSLNNPIHNCLDTNAPNKSIIRSFLNSQLEHIENEEFDQNQIEEQEKKQVSEAFWEDIDSIVEETMQTANVPVCGNSIDADLLAFEQNGKRSSELERRPA
jgi:hypothetical protein